MLFDMSALLVLLFPKTLFIILFLYPIACFILTNSYFSLHYCISLYSASSILLHLFFFFFFFSFHPVCFVLTKGPKLLTSTCPFNTSAYSEHDLWALDYFFIYYMRTIPKLLEHYSIVLLLYTNLSLLSYFITAGFCHYGQIWCASPCKDCCICIHIYTILIVTCLRHI